MRFVRTAAVVILRPIYKIFFERPLWWFLGRVKAFLLAEIGPQLEKIARRLAAIEDRLGPMEAQFSCVEQSLHAVDVNNAAQWSALEKLLLALYRQPELRMESEGRIAQWLDAISTAVGKDPGHERNNLR